jgi:3-deoxy-7-phosphoheptulonate synthase
VTRIDSKLFEVDPAVTKVMHVQEPYKLASRAFHPDDSIIDVSGVKVGGDNLALIAGPCSVESVDQVLEIAKAAKASGANMLRGGAFKPRTSPYSFQDSVLKVWISSVKQKLQQDFQSLQS